MFFDKSLDDEISLLENYLSVNDIIYQQEIIKSKFDEFDKTYSELNAKCNAGLSEYSLYNDLYVELKRKELLKKLFDEYPGLRTWARRLKMAIFELGRKTVDDAGMLFGVNDVELLPGEILYNEEQARKYLAMLKIRKSAIGWHKK